MAISISIPEAASQFAFLVDRVKHGEEVTILEAGVAIARLVRCLKTAITPHSWARPGESPNRT